MKRYCYTSVLFLAALVAAGTGTETARAEGNLTEAEKTALATKRQEQLHDAQMKGLAACIAGVFCVTALFWGLNLYNKSQKQKARIERQEAAADDVVPMEEYIPLPAPTPSEPSASDW